MIIFTNPKGRTQNLALIVLHIELSKTFNIFKRMTLNLISKRITFGLAVVSKGRDYNSKCIVNQKQPFPSGGQSVEMHSTS